MDVAVRRRVDASTQNDEIIVVLWAMPQLLLLDDAVHGRNEETAEPPFGLDK